jgi:hypothetical protein
VCDGLRGVVGRVFRRWRTDARFARGGASRCPPLLGMRYARLRLLCERMQPALRGVGDARSACRAR